MTAVVNALTPYPEVDALLRQLLDGVRERLGPHFVGMYLYGSLAAGDFSLESSDIDFLVATDDDLPGELCESLRAMHARLALSDSKAAARWALGALDGRWHELIRQALAWPGVPLPENLEDTLDLIRHTSEAGETPPAGLD